MKKLTKKEYISKLVKSLEAAEMKARAEELKKISLTKSAVAVGNTLYVETTDGDKGAFIFAGNMVLASYTENGETKEENITLEEYERSIREIIEEGKL